MDRVNVNPPELSEKDIERFWKYVDIRPIGCWEWRGARIGTGYGSFAVKRESRLAHRLAYLLSRGYWPQTLVMHSCDNPPCVNPAHLSEGTNADNLADMRHKGRSAKGQRNGMHTHPEGRHYGDKNGVRTHPERVIRGERHPLAKITDARISEMRALFAAGKHSQRAIARLYGVSQTYIRDLLHCRKRLL